MRKEILFLIILVLPVMSANMCVQTVISDISPSSVGVDKDFTVGITLDSCGTSSAKNIIFELYDISEEITIKEPLRREIGDMGYSNTDRFITYHMRTSDVAEPGIYHFKYRLTYGEEVVITDAGSFPVTVIGERAELSIASLKTNPVLPREGETVELTMRIENTGDGTAKSVSVYAEHEFQGLRQSFIGALKSEEDGPVVLTFIVDKAGEFEIPVTISYKDDFGDNEIKTNINVNVLDKELNVGGIVFAIIIVVVFGWGIYYFIRTKKSKDKIIHQLLSGETKDKISSSTNEVGVKGKKEKRVRRGTKK